MDKVGRHKEEEKWQTGINRKLSQCNTSQGLEKNCGFCMKTQQSCEMYEYRENATRAWLDQSLGPGSPNRLGLVRDK